MIEWQRRLYSPITWLRRKSEKLKRGWAMVRSLPDCIELDARFHSMYAEIRRERAKGRGKVPDLLRGREQAIEMIREVWNRHYHG